MKKLNFNNNQKIKSKELIAVYRYKNEKEFIYNNGKKVVLKVINGGKNK